MTTVNPRAPGTSGFTLLELILALTIFVLVIGSLYASLSAGANALVAGKETMERYQTARAGLNFVLKDLRKSLAPAALPFTEEEEEPLPGFEDDLFYREEEDNQLQITFTGDSKQVQFVVRQELETDEGPSLDIREVRYFLDDDKALVKEAYRSLLIARLQDSLRRKREAQFPGDPRFEQWAPSPAEMGMLDRPIRQVIVEDLFDIEFSYFDGEEWRDSWDSEEIIVNEYALEIPEEFWTEEDTEKVGLPRLVRVNLSIQENITLMTTSDIPGSALNGLSRSGESDFGSAFRSNRDRQSRILDRSMGSGR